MLLDARATGEPWVRMIAARPIPPHSCAAVFFLNIISFWVPRYWGTLGADGCRTAYPPTFLRGGLLPQRYQHDLLRVHEAHLVESRNGVLSLLQG